MSIRTTPELTAHLEALIEALCMEAGAFTCMEADMIVDLYDTFGLPHLGSHFMTAHAEKDLEGDDHYVDPDFADHSITVAELEAHFPNTNTTT